MLIWHLEQSILKKFNHIISNSIEKVNIQTIQYLPYTIPETTGIHKSNEFSFPHLPESNLFVQQQNTHQSALL